ncbi:MULTISPECIES: membrane-targeted effector domain-containing toxin [unclassified Pseudomonas]|uniref:membrane-targeted effector domain-containing toxin n=1 Tax=Pseudomonas sp. Ant30-3 TaxID=1488328 RepID=UPI00048FB23C|nr:membrane-targeted effector domain-containing toxin [Pseudomonas sp. Ant30-3]
MSSITAAPMPNASDKATLKAIAARIVTACPSLQDTAHEVASGLLTKYGVTGLDPDQVYFHRFRLAQSNPKTFTGWEHFREKPYESMTLTQLVIHRFRATDQDNADLLDLYAGFYTAGPQADDFNESNEVRLHGNEVLKDFWSINFSDLYRTKLQTFWKDSSDDFRTLAKCNFLGKAIDACESGRLTTDDFQTVVNAVTGEMTWPVNLQKLEAETPADPAVRICTLDIAGYVSANILRIVDPKGRQIIYSPGEAEPFQVLETPADMHWWALQHMNDEAPRQAFMNHFRLADRHAIGENISDLMDRLVSTWGHSDHHLINQKDQSITGDAFTWLRDSTQTAMFAEADLSLTSNGDLRKKLWVGYLSAGLKVFGPMAAIGWPVALPVIGASLINMGLNIDQAVNGRTASERKNGVIGAVLNGIDAVFNIPFLKGTGSLAEVGESVDAVEAAEMADLLGPNELPETPEAPEQPAELMTAEEPEEGLPIIEGLPATTPETAQTEEVARHYQINELLDGYSPIDEPGKFQGIYRLDSDPPYAIMMNDTAYNVHYFPDAEGGGHWAIVDPARPNQFIHSLPVRLNAEGDWERMPRLGLKAGGQCIGKACIPEADLDASEAAEVEQVEPTPRNVRVVVTSYTARSRWAQKRWALGLRQTHVEVRVDPISNRLISVDHYRLDYALVRQRLLRGSALFYKNLVWANLPPRPVIPQVTPLTTTSRLIEQIFESAPGLVVGESLDRVSSMRFMIENLPTLARQGVKTIYMRRLVNDFIQSDLNSFFETGVMPGDLGEYLTSLGTDPSGQFNELQIVIEARQHGIRVQATNCAAVSKYPGLAEAGYLEQMAANHLTNEIFAADRLVNGDGKWVVLTGAENTNTFRGLAGISELEGGIGVRIEEVNPGQGQRIAIDPGLEVTTVPSATSPMRGTFDTLQADLLLQMEAPLLVRTELEIEKLLTRPGMYLFEKSDDVFILHHRSQHGGIVRTWVEHSADGGYSINRPSWTDVNQVRFSSLDMLSHALERRGMTLQSRLPS